LLPSTSTVSPSFAIETKGSDGRRNMGEEGDGRTETSHMGCTFDAEKHKVVQSSGVYCGNSSFNERNYFSSCGKKYYFLPRFWLVVVVVASTLQAGFIQSTCRQLDRQKFSQKEKPNEESVRYHRALKIHSGDVIIRVPYHSEGGQSSLLVL
jgi:hypothetical protein